MTQTRGKVGCNTKTITMTQNYRYIEKWLKNRILHAINDGKAIFDVLAAKVVVSLSRFALKLHRSDGFSAIN